MPLAERSSDSCRLLDDPECEKENHPESVVLLSPLCHKKRITLVCLAQDFPYEWPLNVAWARDGENITDRLFFATEPVQRQGKCHFAIASRLSIQAKEWQEGHNYSCHIYQGTLVEKSDWVKSESVQKGAPASSISEVQLSLFAAHFIFLLLGAKSLAYSAALGIYTVYRKRGL